MRKITFLTTLAAAVLSMPMAVRADSVQTIETFEESGATAPNSFAYYDNTTVGNSYYGPLVGGYAGDGVAAVGVASGFDVPSAGDPSTTAGFVQIGGAISESFTPNASGYNAIQFLGAGRPGTGGNQLTITLADITHPAIVIAPFPYSPPSTSEFTLETLRPGFALSSGDNYSLTFKGTGTSDVTTFIDNVQLAAVPLPHAAAGGALLLAGLAVWKMRGRVLDRNAMA